MGFTINFYSFSKRSNSTARPGAASLSTTCEIKRGSGLLNPTIELDIGLNTAPAYNYAYIADFGARYYWVREWTFDRGLWVAQLDVDVLATAKNYIGAASLYVLRAASAYDGYIKDELYPADTGFTFSSATGSFGWSYTGGTFIVGIVSKNADFGSLKYYALTPAQMATLTTYLVNDGFSTTEQLTLDGGSVALVNSLVNPLQYFKSCIYIPIARGSLSSVLKSAGTLTVYNWDVSTITGAQCVDPDHPVYAQTVTITVADHPQVASRGAFLNDTPYTERTLYAPVFGGIQLDPGQMIDASALTLQLRVDVCTGQATLDVYADDGGNTLHQMNHLEGMVGVQINLSQVTRDWLGATESVVGGALASLANPANIGSNILNTIGNAVNAMRPKCESLGGGGSFANLYLGNAVLQNRFAHLVSDDLTEQGRPLCAVRTISTLSGYVQVMNGDISAPYTEDELDKIRTLLEGGFYYE